MGRLSGAVRAWRLVVALALMSSPGVAQVAGPSVEGAAALARLTPAMRGVVPSDSARHGIPTQVKGGAIAGAIFGVVPATLFALSDNSTEDKVWVGLGMVATCAAVGALLGLLVGAL